MYWYVDGGFEVIMIQLLLTGSQL